MATSRQWRYAGLMAAGILVVLFIGSADAWECPAGYKDCNWRKPGCETNIWNDVNNCGDCGKKCKAVPYATVKCNNGQCVPTCQPGWANCDGNWWNGCETDTGKDVHNCGGCGKACKQVPYATTKCSGGQCQTPVCKKGWANCDGNWWNGCETDTGKDVHNCGGCGMACKQVPYATTKCSGGECLPPVCKKGWANCDGNWWNGCETHTGKDVKNCGGCGKTCKQVPYAVTKCSGGQCEMPVCKKGWANCDGNWWNGCETDTDKDVKNCGECGKDCKQVPYATTKCSDGKCLPPVCNKGWANCDGNWWNGCETDTDKDVKNCGECGKACKQVPYATTKCSDGKCLPPVCNKGWANCDGNWWNGCETDTDKDVKNCGECGKACKQVPYATTKCSDGKCLPPVCNKGWANCDGNWWNGCETDTDKDVKNCGECGKACNQVPYATTKCSDGKCLPPVCNKGWANCDGNWWNGCETDTDKDVKNCGGCGKTCEVTVKGAYATCSDGQCGQECEKGWKIDWAMKSCVKIDS